VNKVLIHSIVFSPDAVSTAYLYNDIALKLKSCNYDVSVLTTTPHYNVIKSELKNQKLTPRLFGLYYVSNFNGITVKHVPQKKFNNSLLRIIGFVYWHIISFILGLCENDVDIILSPSPPLTIGLINILLAKIKKVKVIYNVQEIYPDLLIQQKKLKNIWTIKNLRRIERYVYNKSDAVTTIDEIFFNIISERFVDKSKLHIIPNFVDTSIYKPVNRNTLNLDESIFQKNSALKLMYAGNIGFAQDWETLINLAIKLHKENIVFYVIGEGIMKSWLENEIKNHHLDNIIILPYQNRDMMPSLLAFSDMQFIFMSVNTAELGFPSKVYTIMACGKPMLVCSKENTPIINFLKDKNCAFLIKEQDLGERVKQLTDIIKNTSKEMLERKGRNGLNEINQYYTKEIVTQKYVDLINSLLE